MRSLVRCQYCGYMVGDTRDHVIHKSILHLYPRSPMYVVVKACRKCNETKRDSLYLPTLANIHDVIRTWILNISIILHVGLLVIACG